MPPLTDPDVITFVVFATIPASFGVAILCHRLYGIDVIIRRTLVYGRLVAILAAFYLGTISTLGAFSRALIGGSGTLAVTVSTLAAFAAFHPLRQRSGIPDAAALAARH
jgi:two-component system NarL family sensor kinase